MDESPLVRRIPLRIEATYQLFSNGLGNPASTCKIRTIFKYWRTELKHNRLDKKAMYLPKSYCDNGTGAISSLLQNSKYASF